MNVKFNNDEIITDFVLGFADATLSKPEQASFTELMAQDRSIRRQAFTNWYIKTAFSFLKPVRTSKKFDQKMAARFALELERETVEKNKNRSEQIQSTY